MQDRGSVLTTYHSEHRARVQLEPHTPDAFIVKLWLKLGMIQGRDNAMGI